MFSQPDMQASQSPVSRALLMDSRQSGEACFVSVRRLIASAGRSSISGHAHGLLFPELVKTFMATALQCKRMDALVLTIL